MLALYFVILCSTNETVKQSLSPDKPQKSCAWKIFSVDSEPLNQLVLCGFFFFLRILMNIECEGQCAVAGIFSRCKLYKHNKSNSNIILYEQDTQQCLFWVFITCSLVCSLWNTWDTLPFLTFDYIFSISLKGKKIAITAVKGGSWPFFPKEGRDAVSWAVCRNM